ncbi:MAG TPA: peptidoglycan editing factor PgeF [Mycobacteriales bacterium]|nr:peptidoglycan editing factor PgeF [Mycobacteriales bacterium]
MAGPTPLRVDLGPDIIAAFTTRVGGVSSPPYAELNLAFHVGDENAAVVANRARSAGSLGVDAARVTWADQVHGSAVALVSEADAGSGALSVRDAIPLTDALVTTEPRCPLAVLVADCVPVLLADAAEGVVAAVHAGRRGLVAGVLDGALRTMGELGARCANVVAVIGPAIGGCCYEVGTDVYAEVATVLPATAATSSGGARSLDLVAGVQAVLASWAVPTARVVGGCTSCSPDQWFSYRRDGVTGRMAAVIWRQ